MGLVGDKQDRSVKTSLFFCFCFDAVEYIMGKQPLNSF